MLKALLNFDIKNLGPFFNRLALFGFLTHLLLIFMAKSGLGDHPLLTGLNPNYLEAIYTPFSFILFYEVMVLIFSIPQSMTTSVKIQYQIISLITLRNVFKDIAAFDSFDFSSDLHVLQKILFDMGGGILMFGLVALFHCIVIKHGKLKQVESEGKLKAFIMSKKIVSALLALLLCYFSVKSFYFWATDVYGVAYLGEDPSINYKTLFYVDLFSVMIFTDILILLISMVYNSSYEILMRNAGFVVSTVMIRISFSLVSPYNNIVAALAILSGSIVLWITHIYKDKNND